MATIEELQAQLAALTARVDAITAPPETYYTMQYTGETIDAILTDLLPARTGGAGLPVSQGGTGATTKTQAIKNLGAMATLGPEVGSFDTVLDLVNSVKYSCTAFVLQGSSLWSAIDSPEQNSEIGYLIIADDALNADRKIVIAFNYSATKVWVRSAFQGAWRSGLWMVLYGQA